MTHRRLAPAAAACLAAVAFGAILGAALTRGDAADAKATPSRDVDATTVVVTGAATPLLRVAGLGDLVVGCAGGRPSARWRNASQATELAGVSGTGVRGTVRSLGPGGTLTGAVAAASNSTWQVGVLSEARRDTATVVLTLSARGGSCIASVSASVSRGGHDAATLHV